MLAFPCGGYHVLAVDGGHVAARVGYGLQDHPSQLLATLALAYVPIDYPIRAGETTRTVADLVESEKLGCRAGRDVAEVDRLVALRQASDLEEQPGRAVVDRADGHGGVVAAAAGRSARNHDAAGADLCAGSPPRVETTAGRFLRAGQTYVDEYQQHFLRTQYGDGSWSCRPAAGQASDRDFASQFLYSGQAAEWLALSLPAAKLEEPALVKSVEFLDGVLNSERVSLERAGAEQPRHRRRGECRRCAGGIRHAGVQASRRPRAGSRSEAEGRPAGRYRGGRTGRRLGHAIERARRLREFARFWELSQAASPGRQPGDKAASSQGGGDLNTDAPGSRTHQFAPGDSR